MDNQPVVPPTDDIISLFEMAKPCSLPVKWLGAQAVAGHIPHLKVGRRHLFSLAAVKQELAKMAAGRPGQAGEEPAHVAG